MHAKYISASENSTGTKPLLFSQSHGLIVLPVTWPNCPVTKHQPYQWVWPVYIYPWDVCALVWGLGVDQWMELIHADTWWPEYLAGAIVTWPAHVGGQLKLLVGVYSHPLRLSFGKFKMTSYADGYALKQRAVMMPTLSSLDPPQVIIMTTCGASSDNKAGIMATLSVCSMGSIWVSTGCHLENMCYTGIIIFYARGCIRP